MRQYQGRVRRMRRPGQKPGPARSADGIRQTYYDPAIRAAKAAQAVAARSEGQAGDQS